VVKDRDQTARRNPESVLYGVWKFHESFCLLDETEAHGRAAEVKAIQAATMLGGVRKVDSTLRYMGLPFHPEDHEGEPDDTPWDWQDEGTVTDGDWPGMPTAYALDAFPDKAVFRDLVDATGAEGGTTVFNGDYLQVPVSKERELVDTLSRHGIRAIRDDAVIHALAGSQDV